MNIQPYVSKERTQTWKRQYEYLSIDHPDPCFLLINCNFTVGTHVIFYKGLYFDIRVFHLKFPNVGISEIVYTGIVVYNKNPDCVVQTYGTIKLESHDSVKVFGFDETQYGCSLALGKPSDQFDQNVEVTIQIWSESNKLSLLRIGALQRRYNPFKVFFRFFGPEPPILPAKYNLKKNQKTQYSIIDPSLRIIELGTFVVYKKVSDSVLDIFFGDNSIFKCNSVVSYEDGKFVVDPYDVPARVIGFFFYHKPSSRASSKHDPCFTTATANDYKDPKFLSRQNPDFQGVLFVCRNECSRPDLEDDNTF